MAKWNQPTGGWVADPPGATTETAKETPSPVLPPVVVINDEGVKEVPVALSSYAIVSSMLLAEVEAIV